MASQAMTTSRAGSEAAGFTLIELVFVTLALGLLVTSAAPAFRQAWVGVQSEQAAVRLAQTLRAARVLAVAQARPVGWVWDAEPRGVGLRYLLDDGATEPVPGRLGRSFRIAERVRLDVRRDGAMARRVRFFPDGTSDPATILVGDTTPRYRITVHGATSHVAIRSIAAAPTFE